MRHLACDHRFQAAAAIAQQADALYEGALHLNSSEKPGYALALAGNRLANTAREDAGVPRLIFIVSGRRTRYVKFLKKWMNLRFKQQALASKSLRARV